LFKFVDRHDFNRIEQGGFKPRRKSRTLNRWNQFVAMMFAQLTGRCSLRDIADQFRSQASRLYHLGVRPVKRSTLSDANHDRPADFFQALFDRQYARCAAIAPKKKFRFKYKPNSFDSSVVNLCLSLFPRARFQETKGGIELHTLLDHEGYLQIVLFSRRNLWELFHPEPCKQPSPTSGQ